MGINVRIDKSLVEVLESIRRNVAVDMKKQYGIDEIEVPSSMSSKIAAARLKGRKSMNFRIRKVSHKKGVLELF